MKGIVLAGGTATRLYPLTIVTNKHLLPIYDRPMIYYPIETLAGMGIREVMVVVGGPERFGVAELDRDGRVVGFEEKPKKPKSHLIPIGVYFLRPNAFEVIDHLAPSGRGELEITDVLNHYIPEGGLFTRVYDGHWTDAGTVPSLLRAAELAARDQAQGRLSPPVERPSQ